MPVTQAMNSKANVKKSTNGDLPFSSAQPVMSSFYAVSTAGQSVINLNFSVDQTLTDQFFLFVDGKKLRLGSGNDYTFTSVGSDGKSSQVTLNFNLPVGINIQAHQLGMKSEVEFGTDARFVQAYEVLGEGFQSFVKNSVLVNATTSTGAPVAGTFYSSIQNRAAMVDPSQDLRPRFGISRITTQQIMSMPAEYGPNGEPVYAPSGEGSKNVRFVGPNWLNAIGVTGAGPIISSGNAQGLDYAEVTFFGTGLSMLFSLGVYTTLDIRATTDGGVESGNLAPAAASGATNNRNYANNTVIPLVSGLTLGTHTVRVRFVANSGIGAQVYGFETLTESSTVVVTPGIGYVQGKKYTAAAQSTYALASGVTGTRGGRVVSYLNGNGTIGQAFQAVNPSQANLNAADHSNEEVARVFSFREFAVGRTSDDFSGVANGSNRAFTLDDGTTTLTASQIDLGTFANRDSLRLSTLNGFITITFVGTGLDVTRYDESVIADTISVTVDGVNVGNLSTTGITSDRTQKLVSGLPYGTHTVRLTLATAGSGRSLFNKFIAYQPKKPVAPSGTVELSDYNVMANYVGSTSDSSTAAPSTGTLMKMSTREIYYSGTWSATSVVPAVNAGWQITSSTSGSYAQYTFFGTGIEISTSQGAATSAIVRVDGVNYTGAATTAPNTNNTWTPGTSTWAFSSAVNATLQISGLALGLHTVRITLNASVAFYINQVNVITPLHSYKRLSQSLQGTNLVGSEAIRDTRAMSPVKSENVAKASASAYGVVSSPTTTATVPVPCPDLNVLVTTSGGDLDISYRLDSNNSSATVAQFTQVYVDGVAVGKEIAFTGSAVGGAVVQSETITVQVPAGTHRVEVYWWVGSGTATAILQRRSLRVKES